MFKSKWETCLEKINHWSNCILLLKTEVRDLAKGHSDLRSIYMSHHSEIERLKTDVMVLENKLTKAFELIHFLEVKTASQQRTVIHKYEMPKAIGKGKESLLKKAGVAQ